MYFIIRMDSLTCFGVRHSKLIQVLEVWHISGYIRLSILCCRYIKDNVNYLLYIIFPFLQGGYLSEYFYL